MEGGLSEVNNRLVIEVINRLEGPITKTCPVFLEKSVCNVESKLRLGIESIFRERTIGFQIFTCFGLSGMANLWDWLKRKVIELYQFGSKMK